MGSEALKVEKVHPVSTVSPDVVYASLDGLRRMMVLILLPPPDIRRPYLRPHAAGARRVLCGGEKPLKGPVKGVGFVIVGGRNDHINETIRHPFFGNLPLLSAFLLFMEDAYDDLFFPQ